MSSTPPKPEYEQFADQARESIASQQAIHAAYQGLAKALLEGQEVDVRAGEPKD
jgi:hypothetical protein